MLTERFNPILEPERFKFSFEMFEALSDNGHFGNKKVELLNGEILVKGLQSDDHVYAIQNLTDIFYAHLVEQTVIRVQLPLVLESPPPDFVLPDIALLKLPKLQYKTRTANSSDALLVVEMSNSTLDYDQSTKLEAYARNLIPEYWIYHVNTQSTRGLHSTKRTNLCVTSHAERRSNHVNSRLEYFVVVITVAFVPTQKEKK